MKEIALEIWEALVKYYMIYSDFIHSIFKDQLGDLVVGVIDIVIAVIIIKSLSQAAFGKGNN